MNRLEDRLPFFSVSVCMCVQVCVCVHLFQFVQVFAAKYNSFIFSLQRRDEKKTRRKNGRSLPSRAAELVLLFSHVLISIRWSEVAVHFS